jgi:hypothetical protein
MTPVVALAAAVLKSARDDLASPIVARRASATAFFKPTSEGLEFWAAVAGLDPAFVIRRVSRDAKRLVAAGTK